MWRRIQIIVLMLAVGLPASADQVTSARFRVQAMGVGVGTLQLIASVNARGYSASTQFATTGAARQVAKVRFTMKSAGRRSGARFVPQYYSEKVETGRRRSSAELRYQGNAPVLSGGRADAQNAAPLSPASQRGTIDPMTAMLMATGDQPASDLCTLDQTLFDGARRTRIVLRNRKQTGDSLVCSGWFERLGGYSARQMADGRRFSVAITYGPGANGMMQARKVRLQTVYGPVILTRR